jgi:hypothetical protein
MPPPFLQKLAHDLADTLGHGRQHRLSDLVGEMLAQALELAEWGNKPFTFGEPFALKLLPIGNVLTWRAQFEDPADERIIAGTSRRPDHLLPVGPDIGQMIDWDGYARRSAGRVVRARRGG